MLKEEKLNSKFSEKKIESIRAKMNAIKAIETGFIITRYLLTLTILISPNMMINTLKACPAAVEKIIRPKSKPNIKMIIKFKLILDRFLRLNLFMIFSELKF